MGRTHLVRRKRDTPTTVPQEVLPPPTCATVIPSGIRSSVHVLHAKEVHGCRAVVFWLLLNSRRLKYLSFSWSEWVTNCTKTLSPSSFPNPVPSEIRVPQWALIDLTDENDWNANQSHAVGDSPEVGPGSIIAPSTAATATSSSRPSSTGSPTSTNGTNGSSGGGSSNTGAIVGGVVGGIAAICIAVVAIIYQQRRSQPQPAVLADVVESKVLSSPPEAPEEGTTAPSSLSGSPAAMKLYDPNDPTTFPGYQADLHSPDIPSQVTMSSNIGSGNAVANAQTTQPHAGGYHGHPIV